MRGFRQPVWILGLAGVLAACGGGRDTSNRDNLPRRTPSPPADTSAQAPDRPPEQPPAIPPARDNFYEDMADYQRQRDAAFSNLQAAIGTPVAQMESECRLVPVGARACGGPAGYLVTSATGQQELEIVRLAGLVTALDREANAQFGLVSTCEVIPAPALVVENGVCVAR